MSTMRILTAAAFATVFAVSTASAQQVQRVAGTIVTALAAADGATKKRSAATVMATLPMLPFFGESWRLAVAF